MAVGDAVFYDPFTFRKHFKNIGRAYREQATTLIEICRLYSEGSPQTYTKDDHIQNILGLADAALSAAGRAKKGKSSEAADAFLRVQEEIKLFGSPSPRKDAQALGKHRKKLPIDPTTALESASKKDEKSTSTISKVKSAFTAPLPSGQTKKVNFVILKSPHERSRDQLIIRQEIDNSTTATEIIWRFSRYPEKSPERITPRQNPHFYHRLPDKPASYDSQFHKAPLKDFAHRVYRDDTIYILLDKSCRLFLDAAKPHTPRIFGNLWKPYGTVILKDVGGILDSEDTVLGNIGERQDYWHRPSITNSAQRRVQSVYSGGDSEVVNKLVENGRALVDVALRSQFVDLMIRDRSMPEPLADSGWEPLPSSELSARAVPEETTHRQSTTHVPQSSPNASVPSIGGHTLFTTSTGSFETSETSVDTSDISHPITAVSAADERIHADSGIDLRLKLPSGNISRPPSSAPLLGDPSIPSSLPRQDQEPLSAPPASRGRRKNWFPSWYQKKV